jgi:hypothetical protein
MVLDDSGDHRATIRRPSLDMVSMVVGGCRYCPKKCFYLVVSDEKHNFSRYIRDK